MRFIFMVTKFFLAVSISAFVFTFILLFRNTLFSRSPDKTLPSTYQLPYEEVSFYNKDKLRLKGWFIFKQKNAPVIILCHGLGANKSDLLGIAKFISDAGYNTFLFDFRGHGESQGKFTSFGYLEQRDLEGAVDYIEQRQGLEKASIGVLGVSMGAAVAVITAAKDKRIKAVVSDSSYRDLYSSLLRHAEVFYHFPRIPLGFFLRLAYLVRFGIDPKRVSPCREISAISPQPVLIINGSSDSRIPVENAKVLFENSRNPKELWIIPKAGYAEGSNRYYEEYRKRVLEFLSKNLQT
ncbi:MAG: alpha/beta hydrolase [Candidatus Omnitrophica bacterium]|nr:alpha/beta hydrolase [Candidatus Omnitrophota bacterium]